MKYIKNVTSKIEPIAYENENGIFNLHLFQIPQNIKAGETILLYQNPNGIGSCFTDLVVIVKDEVNQVQNNENHSYSIKGQHLLNNTNTPLWDNVPHGGYTSGTLVSISQLNVVLSGVVNETDLINEAWGLFFP